MFKQINETIKKRGYLKNFLAKKDIKEKIGLFLKREDLDKEVSFKIRNKKEVYFFCSNHPIMNILKMKEEGVRKTLGNESISFRYFLKEN